MAVNPAQHLDVGSIDAIVSALYESISFPPGMQPDYSRMRMLFHPQAIVIPPRTDRSAALRVLDVETFITQSRDFVVTSGAERTGFSEREIARRTESFGGIVHLFSTYESKNREQDARPLQRGVNSIQLARDAGRWWVLSILWDIERPGNPIPQKYLI